MGLFHKHSQWPKRRRKLETGVGAREEVKKPSYSLPLLRVLKRPKLYRGPMCKSALPFICPLLVTNRTMFPMKRPFH